MKLVVRTSSTMVGGMSALMASTAAAAAALNEAENRHTWQTIKWTDSSVGQACIQLHGPQGHIRRRPFYLSSTTFSFGSTRAVARCCVRAAKSSCGNDDCIADVDGLCVWCKRSNISEHQTKSNTIIESNNYSQALWKRVMWRCSLAESPPVELQCELQWKSVCLIFIREFVCAQCIRWWPMSTICVFVYLLSTINNWFDWNLFNTAAKRERSIPTNIFISFFHFPSFFIVWFVANRFSVGVVGTWNEDKIFSSHKTHTTRSAQLSHTHTHTHVSWLTN